MMPSIILTFAQWAVLLCSEPDQTMLQTAQCRAWVHNCLVSEYNQSKDPDWAFEICAENIPDHLLGVPNVEIIVDR